MSADIYLFNDIANRRLIVSAAAGGASTAQLPILYFGDAPTVNWHAVKVGGNNGLASTYLDYSTATLKLAINKDGAEPTAGVSVLTWEGDATAEIAFDDTDTAVAAALNALDSIDTAGGVTVTDVETDRGLVRQVKWVSPGARSLLTSDDDGLIPQTTTLIGRAVVGDVDTCEVQELRFFVNPPVFQDTWTDLPAAAAAAAVIQAGDATHNAIVKFTLPDDACGGTFGISTTLPTVKATSQIAYDATTATILAALETTYGADNATVTQDGDGQSFIVEFVGELELTDVGTFAVSVTNLSVPIGKTAQVEINGEYLETLLDTDEEVSAILEIEVTPSGGEPSITLHQKVIVARTVSRSQAIAPLATRTALGTAATRNTGTTAGTIPLLDSSARLPAVNGSLLTNLPVPATAVVGPSSATDGNVVVFNGTTGKLVKNGGALGDAASLDVGTTTGTVCAGNDSRLGDSRTPTAHASSHSTGQSDAITPGNIGAATSGHNHDSAYEPKTLTTKGDLLTFGTSAARLPAGTNGYVLTADSTQTLGIKWAEATGGLTALGEACATSTARLALTSKPFGYQVVQTDTHHIYLLTSVANIANEGGWSDLGDLANYAPAFSVAVSHTGTEQVGSTLTMVDGTYAGRPTASIAARKWQRSDTGTSGWADINGATSSTYDLTSSDLDKYVRPAQQASNALGTAWSYGASSAQISAAPAANKRLASVTVAEGYAGSGYAENQIQTLVGGTYSEAAQVKITSVDGNGAVLTVAIVSGHVGNYSATPSDPVDWAGSQGSGGMVDCTWEDIP